MVRTTGGTIAEAELSVTQVEKVTAVKASQTSSVTPNGIQTTTVASPPGTVLSATAVRLVARAPSGATTGFHRVSFVGPNSRVKYLQASAPFNEQVIVDKGVVQKATRSAIPGDEAAQAAALNSIIADDTNGLKVKYENLTDATQSQKRDIQLIGLERGAET